MEVIKKQWDSCSFADISIGDCFVLDTDIDAVFMRIVATGSNEFNCRHQRAVDLTDGRILEFKGDEEVFPVRAKVVLE